MAVLSLLNSILTAVVEGALWPFRALSPLWPLVFVSAVAGVLLVWAFGRLSNQRAIRKHRNRIRGHLLGVRLFRHDPRVVVTLQGRIFRETALYLRHSIMPLVVLAAPVVLLMAQLDLHFASRPLAKGERALVKATVRDASALAERVHLRSGPGVVVETPGVRIPSEREVTWRIRARAEGRHVLSVETRDGAAEKEIVVGAGWGDVSARRTAGGLDMLLHPGEPPIDPTGPIESVEISYPSLGIRALGWKTSWLVVFLLASLASAFLVKGFLGVEV